MSFKQQHINLSNYEEFFILYMDKELTAAQQKMVEAFIAVHPNLKDELEAFASTKLVADDLHFNGKEELFSPAMKLTAVEESLLLFIDGELSATEKIKVEEQLKTDKDYQHQLQQLRLARLDTADKIIYPYKKELYRHEAKRRWLQPWMQIAAAIIVILLASYLFIFNTNNKTVIDTAGITQPTLQPHTNNLPVVTNAPVLTPEKPTTAQAPVLKNALPVIQKNISKQSPAPQQKVNNGDVIKEDVAAVSRPEAIQFDVARFKGENDVALNNIMANATVTSAASKTYNSIEAPEETIVIDGDEKQIKKAPAKGFLRKVSRFIERRTGIGTVNADNELLIGAVAFKLK